MDPVPDPLLLRKSGSAGDRTRDLCICSQKLRPLDHRGGPLNRYIYCFLFKQILWSNPPRFQQVFLVNICLDSRHLDYVRWSQNQLRHDSGARESKPLSLQIFNGRDDLGDVSVDQHWRQQSKWTSEDAVQRWW